MRDGTYTDLSQYLPAYLHEAQALSIGDDGTIVGTATDDHYNTYGLIWSQIGISAVPEPQQFQYGVVSVLCAVSCLLYRKRSRKKNIQVN